MINSVITRRMMAGLAVAAALGLAVGVGSSDGPAKIFSNHFFILTQDPGSGRVNVLDQAGAPRVKGAAAAVVLECGGGMERRLAAGGRDTNFIARPVETPLGQGTELASETETGGFKLSRIITVYEAERSFTARLEVIPGDGPLSRCKIKAMEPWVLAGEGKGLDLGGEAKEVLALENGANLYFDFMVNLRRLGDQPPLPGSLITENSVSNFSSILYSPSSGRSALAGFITMNEGIGLIVSGGVSSRSSELIPEHGGREVFRPPLPVNARERWVSETVFLNFFAPTPFAALENYAQVLSKQLGAKPWAGPVPSGWNSWGEYYTKINEKIVLENLDFAAQNFRDFGMNYFQIDDGYGPFWGDWSADPLRFPHGLAWLAERIREKGLTPGIWIAPFCADVRSATYRAHPDWFLPRQGAIPRLMIEKSLRVLDLSNPSAREFLRATIRQYVKEWGYEWLKVDFSYYFLYYSAAGPGDRTMPDLYREGLRLIKEEAGPNVFVVGIGICGLNYGLVDGMRLSLDNMPAWNDAKDLFVFHPLAGKLGFAQGLAPTARTVARRYWMNHGLWIVHPDLIFFNNDRWPEWSDAPISFEQARAFAALVGFSGGIVKLGDKMVDLTPAEVDVVRRLLPVVRPGGRPLDLFEKATPELWLAHYQTSFEAWDVAGLFNWGENWTPDGQVMTGDRRFIMVPEKLGLDPGREYLAFDFWPEKYLGLIGKSGLEVTVQPGDVRVIALRQATGRPQFLSTNRHLSQGAVELEDVTWDAEKNLLLGTQTAAPGFNYRLYFFAPPPYRLVSAEVEGTDAKVTEPAGVIALEFTVPATGRYNWYLKFERRWAH